MKTRPILLAKVYASTAVILALAGAVNSTFQLGTVPDNEALNSWWRTVGLFVFAALFALLASSDTRNIRLWFILCASKLILVVLALGPLKEIDGSASWLLWDTILVLLTSLGLLSVVAEKRNVDVVVKK